MQLQRQLQIWPHVKWKVKKLAIQVGQVKLVLFFKVILKIKT